MELKNRHGNPTLRTWGVNLTIVGGVLFFVPLFLQRADPFADAHELVTMAVRHLWWQFAGLSVFFLGNTLRLIGVQGHPGLPWPGIGKRPPPDLVASLQLRLRARANRAKALAEAATAAEERPRPRRRRFRFVDGRAIRIYGRRALRPVAATAREGG